MTILINNFYNEIANNRLAVDEKDVGYSIKISINHYADLKKDYPYKPEIKNIPSQKEPAP